MCYQPIRIKNPKKDFDIYRDPLYLTVPCGHCYQCLRKQHLEWYTRAYYEYLKTIKLGGSVLYFTLTYNPENLPVIDGVPCFSKRDVQLFLKRFRKMFNAPNIKYLITCEYGGKTHRPHMHGLIYVPFPVNPHTLKHRLYKAWNKGFVHFGKFGGIVLSPSAISYTCKYICKDLDFDYKNDKLKEARPFHLQSMGFGSYIIEKYKLFDISETDVVKLLADNKISIPDKNGFRQTFIPQYIVRKITTNPACRLDDGTLYLQKNSLGYQVQKTRFEHDVKMTEDSFTHLFNNIENILYDSRRLEVFDKHLNKNFGTATQVRLFLQGQDFHKVALYSKLYADMVVLPVGVFCDIKVPSLSLYDEKSISYQLSLITSPERPHMVYCPKENDSLFADLEDNSYNKFYLAEQLSLQIFNSLNYTLGYFEQLEYDEQQQQLSDLKLIT